MPSAGILHTVDLADDFLNKNTTLLTCPIFRLPNLQMVRLVDAA